MNRDESGTEPPASGPVAAVLQSDALRYRELFEANPLPMWVYDLDTLRFLDVNEVACQKYGYSRDEFLAMTIRDIRPPEDVAAMEQSVRLTPAQVFNSGVWRHRLKDGRLITSRSPRTNCCTGGARRASLRRWTSAHACWRKPRCASARPDCGARRRWPAWAMW